MGTQHNGKKPENRVTISKSSAPARKVDPDTGKAVDRSFAQPNPALPPREVEPKAHASAADEAEALRRHSAEGRQYDGEQDGEGDENQD